MNNSWGFTESLRPSQSWRKPGWQTRRVPGSRSSDISLSLGFSSSVSLFFYLKMRNGPRSSHWKVLSHKGMRAVPMKTLGSFHLYWIAIIDLSEMIFFPSVFVWTSLWLGLINISVAVLFVQSVPCIIYENCSMPYFSSWPRPGGDNFPVKRPSF